MRSIMRAGLLAAMLSVAPASAQLTGARELTTAAPVRGAPASKAAPEIYYFAGESGARETYTLTIKGPASLSLFTPDGHEMLTSTGSGKVTLTAYLNLTDVFTLAVSRVNPAQPYTLSRQSRLPTLIEATAFSGVGYTYKGLSSGDWLQCWITPGVKSRTTRKSRVAEYTLAADRATMTGVAHENGNTSSFYYTLVMSGDTVNQSTHFSDGKIKQTSGTLRRASLDDGITREWTGYLCDH